MTKKRRVILIVVVLAVLGVAGGGIFVYMRRTSGVAILKRAKLALEAGDFEKARTQAEKYIAKEPGDYEGYYFLAQALGGQGKHDEARTALQKAIQCKPDKVSLVFAMADTYSRAAYNTISGKDARDDISRIDAAIQQLIEVEKCLDDYLEKVKPTDEKSVLDIRERLGRNTRRMAELHQALARQLNKESRRLRVMPDKGYDAEAKAKLSLAAQKSADQESDRAIEILLAVIRKDPARGKTGVELLDMCQQRGNDEARDLARKAILALAAPPPDPALWLALDELRDFEKERGLAVRRKKLAETGRVLDKLIGQNPDHIDLKATRMNLALSLDDFALAQRLCDEILKAEPGNFSARFGQAQLLARQGRLRESERQLRSLASQYRLARVHYAHAWISLALGNRMAALHSMQRVRQLDPKHGLARAYLARVAMQKGLPSAAHKDAQAAYEAAPEYPRALRVYVQTCHATKRDADARKALDKIKAGKGLDAEMLMAASDGYALLGERDESTALARRAAMAKARTFRDRVEKARACVRIDRLGEAEKLLLAEVSARPKEGQPRFTLGLLYQKTGRLLEAIEQYQRAVDIEPSEISYRISLARVLLDYGDVKQCRSVLARVDPQNSAGKAMRMELRVIEKHDVNVEDMLQQARKGEDPGLGRALRLLATGQPDDCVDVCKELLKIRPTSLPLRSLLGQAYLKLGKRKECIQEWTKVLKQSPGRYGTYLALCRTLSAGRKLEDVAKELGKIATARKDLIVLAVARLLAERGAFVRAAATIKPMIEHPATPEHMKPRMRTLRVQYLARGGDIKQALVEIKPLIDDKVYGKSGKLEMAMLLAASGDSAQADKTLTLVRRQAVTDADGAMLRRVAGLYMLMHRSARPRRGRGPTSRASSRPAPWLARAEAVCRQVETLLPNDPGSFLLWARLWSLAGKADKMVEAYRKAIACQPGHAGTYLKLASLLDAQNKPDDVLKLLEELEGVRCRKCKRKLTGKEEKCRSCGHGCLRSEAARTAAIWARGRAHVRWGLHGSAADELEKLARAGYKENPRVQLLLGQSLALLGRKRRARELLEKVPLYAAQYVPSRVALVEMTVVNEQKLELLDRLSGFKPKDPAVISARMKVLLAMGRPGDAANAFSVLMEKARMTKRLPIAGPVLALRGLLEQGERLKAAQLALGMYRISGGLRWARVGILLMPADQRAAARKMLGKVRDADEPLAVLGLCLAIEAGDMASAKLWADQANKPPVAKPSLRWRYSQYRLLTHLAVSSEKPDKMLLEQVSRTGPVREEAVAELAGRPPGKQRTAEVAEILRASLALDFDLRELARKWAMAALKARPTCQWAANVAMKTGGEAKSLGEVHALVEPKDGRLARSIQADILNMKGQFDEAVKMYHTAAHTGPQDPLLMLREADATVETGRLTEAMTLYRLVWARSHTARVANAMAYLTTRLHPKDPAKLAEAVKWADYAVARQPSIAHYWDTRGWVTHLRGDNKRALRDLRRVVKALPNSLTVHYHLGKVEAEAGSEYFAKEHLNAVVDISRKLKTEAKTLTSDEAEALRLARAAMKKLLPPGSG